MTGSSSPCGACKFLRRKCIKGCIFAPYFCHEQGASHFSAIHKVFGASNVSKLLSHLPVSDRCEAAVTISYEAQARLQDPIYGCVSHIFALQQQVVNLQAQLASMKEQALKSCFPNGSGTVNPNGKFHSQQQQDVHTWFDSENSNSASQINSNLSSNTGTMAGYYGNCFVNQNSMGNNEYSQIPDENVSYGSFEEASFSMSSLDMQPNNRQWGFLEANELHSMAFSYSQNSREEKPQCNW